MPNNFIFRPSIAKFDLTKAREAYVAQNMMPLDAKRKRGNVAGSGENRWTLNLGKSTKYRTGSNASQSFICCDTFVSQSITKSDLKLVWNVPTHLVAMENVNPHILSGEESS
jgi:hypothetical protein